MIKYLDIYSPWILMNQNSENSVSVTNVDSTDEQSTNEQSKHSEHSIHSDQSDQSDHSDDEIIHITESDEKKEVEIQNLLEENDKPVTANEFKKSMDSIKDIEDELRKKLGVSDDVSREDFMKYCAHMMKTNKSNKEEDEKSQRAPRRRRTTGQKQLKFRKGKGKTAQRSLADIRSQVIRQKNDSPNEKNQDTTTSE